MIIEFVGCTGSGKSTLCKSVQAVLSEKDICVYTAIEKVIGDRLYGMFKQKERLLNIIAEFVLLPKLLSTIFLHRQLIGFSYASLNQGENSFMRKLLLLRSVVRKLAIHRSISSSDTSQEVVLVDEGTVHILNVITANGLVDIPDFDFKTFCRLTPFPMVLIYVITDEKTLIRRTLQRDDPPLRSCSDDTLTTFVRLSNSVYNRLFDDAENNIPSSTILKTSMDDKSSPEDAANLLVSHILHNMKKLTS